MDATVDEELIRRIAAGDQAAMRALFTRYHVKVYRYALRIVRRETLAEDLIGEVFLDVWRQAAKFERRSSVSTWLLGIARHKAYSGLRRKTEDAIDDEAADAIADEADTPETTVQKKDKAGLLRRSLSKLSPEHREIIDLVYYHEQSVEEVSLILGIPENTVKTRMFYARKKLSENLRAMGVDRGWP